MVATSADLTATKTCLKFLPGSIGFDETCLPVANEKKTYLRNIPETHDAFFHRALNGLSIEAIDHHAEPGITAGPFHPVLSTAENDGNQATGMLAECVGNALGCVVGIRKINGISRPLLSITGAEKGIFMTALACYDLDTSIRFWSDGLGAAMEDRGLNPAPWALLSITGLSTNSSAQILLAQLPHEVCPPAMLDDSGWTCMSVLVRPHQDVAKYLSKYGGTDMGTPYTFNIGGKNLTLNFIRSPDGALVELLAPGSS